MNRVLYLSLFGIIVGCSWRDPIFRLHDGSAMETGPDRIADLPTESPDRPDMGPVSACVGRPKPDAGSGPNDGLLVWYRFEFISSGATIMDSSGRGNHGKLASGSDAASGPGIVTGKFGNGLDMVFANKGYVQMPDSLLADTCEVTIATWVFVHSNENAWTRIWDFGQDIQKYMFLTPITNTDNFARFGITTTGNQSEESLKDKAAIPTQVWVHTAVVLGSGGGLLYINGEVVASNPDITLRPPDLGRTANNFIGRSQFSDDPYLDASIDEFRAYDRALSAEAIRALLTTP